VQKCVPRMITDVLEIFIAKRPSLNQKIEYAKKDVFLSWIFFIIALQFIGYKYLNNFLFEQWQHSVELNFSCVVEIFEK
jgi:hypothetical protein